MAGLHKERRNRFLWRGFHALLRCCSEDNTKKTQFVGRNAVSRGIMRAVEELFQEACDLPPEQRQAYCDTAYEQIRAELPSLLAAHVVDASLIDRPPDGLLAGVDLENVSLTEDVRP